MTYGKLVCLSLLLLHVSGQYTPDWESLDTRPLPKWYDEAKIGIFIHWGVYSVPGFYTEWFWDRWITDQRPEIVEFMENNFKPGFTYPDFAKEFKAEFYDPVVWANLFKDAGAKYIVFTSKHHEGYCNWNTSYSFNWNSMDVGPNRNLLDDLRTAILENTDIKFGLYHSQCEWYHPLFIEDRANNFTTQKFMDQKSIPELYELVNTYKPDVVWSDGDWFNASSYCRAKDFLAWLYNDSPVKDTVVVNDRWGKGDARCLHGDFWTCRDRYNPGVLLPHKWESGYTIDKKSWGYVRTSEVKDYLTPEEIVGWIASVVSTGGNVLINIGPTPDGRIEPLMEERLRQMGTWLGINGDSIYSTVPWEYQNDTITPGVWYTSKTAGAETTVYGIVLNWPQDSTLVLGVPKTGPETVVNMLGYNKPLEWTAGESSVSIKFPNLQDIPSRWAWSLSFTHLTN